MAKIDENLNRLFGITLRELRARAGISQQDLTFDCELDQTYISLLERGLRQPTISTVFVLAEKLSIKTSRLIRRIEEQL